MANLPPPPIRDIKELPFSLQQWYQQIRAIVGSGIGAISWASVSKTGSHLSDILDRPHSQLQTIVGNGGYHLSVSERDYAIGSYSIAPSNNAVGASPYTYHNTNTYNLDIIIQGGTVSKLEFSRDNITYYDIGVIAGMYFLSPGDYTKITHTGAPTMTLVPR